MCTPVAAILGVRIQMSIAIKGDDEKERCVVVVKEKET